MKMRWLILRRSLKRVSLFGFSMVGNACGKRVSRKMDRKIRMGCRLSFTNTIRRIHETTRKLKLEYEVESKH
jgi:hypothetical protein